MTQSVQSLPAMWESQVRSLVWEDPVEKEMALFWVLVLEGLIGLHRTIQLQLLQHCWLGHRLGLL